MRFINVKTRRGIINLFADFITTSISNKNKYKTIIQVTDCDNFYVVNGLTESKEFIDLTIIKNNFIKSYGNLIPFDFSKINIIDLVKYNSIIEAPERNCFTYFNSNRPIYHNSIISNNDNIPFEYVDLDVSHQLIYEAGKLNTNISNTNNLYIPQPVSIQSEFPFGYTLNAGRNQLYYFEYIMYELKSGLLSNYATFNIHNAELTTINLNTDSAIKTEAIISLIYDLFDFDYTSFTNTQINDYNICDDLIKPFESKPWLKHRIDPKDKIIF